MGVPSTVCFAPWAWAIKIAEKQLRTTEQARIERERRRGMKTSITSSIGTAGGTVNVKPPLTAENGPLREHQSGKLRDALHCAATTMGLYNLESVRDLAMRRLGGMIPV